MADAITEEISQSNMSRPAKSAIRRWYESMGGGAGLKRHGTETAQAVRQGGESGLMGAALGLIEAERGSLDIEVGRYNVPVDGVAAAVGLLGSVMMANEATGLSADLRNLGSSALSVLAYRKAGGSGWGGSHGPQAKAPQVVLANSCTTRQSYQLGGTQRQRLTRPSS